MDEGERKTLLDVINKGLERNQAKSFIHRIIYVGGHTFEDTSNSLHEYFKDISEKLNAGYCDVAVYGVLLTCPHHFFAIAEGSELTLTRHLSMVCQSKKMHESIQTMKLIHISHNVETRYFSKWNFLFSRSTKSDIDLKLPPEKIIGDCIERAKILCSVEDLKQESQYILNEKLNHFPSDEVIKFILSSDLTMNVESYIDLYMKLPKYSYSFETSWPAPYDFTPCLEPEPESFDSEFVKLLSDISDFNVENDQTNNVGIKNHDKITNQVSVNDKNCYDTGMNEVVEEKTDNVETDKND